MHACIYACMHICMHACMHICMHAYMHVHACMHACIYAYAYAYACMHTVKVDFLTEPNCLAFTPEGICFFPDMAFILNSLILIRTRNAGLHAGVVLAIHLLPDREIFYRRVCCSLVSTFAFFLNIKGPPLRGWRLGWFCNKEIDSGVKKLIL